MKQLSPKLQGQPTSQGETNGLLILMIPLDMALSYGDIETEITGINGICIANVHETIHEHSCRSIDEWIP